MTQRFKLSLLLLVIGLLAATNASASWYACYRTPHIDVRGEASLDADSDGEVTIAEVAVANPLGNLDLLVAAVLAADPLVLEALSNPDANWTVFAPDNAAFEALPAPLLDLALSAPPVLTDILLYHVRNGHFDPRLVFYQRSTKSLLGQDLFIKRGRNNPSVNNSEIDCQGVLTDNGVVWIIDSVLLNQY